jgi:pyruvate/2-oxoglutarate dehydrogenase complex dihydrolipoamide acyltransferase (E2) component
MLRAVFLVLTAFVMWGISGQPSAAAQELQMSGAQESGVPVEPRTLLAQGRGREQQADPRRRAAEPPPEPDPAAAAETPEEPPPAAAAPPPEPPPPAAKRQAPPPPQQRYRY